jgi:hypothetical protein
MNIDLVFNYLVWYALSRIFLHYFWRARQFKWEWRVLLRKQLWIPLMGEIIMMEDVLPSMFSKSRPVAVRVFARRSN